MTKIVGKTGEKFITKAIAKGTDGYIVKVPNEPNVYIAKNKYKEKALAEAIRVRNSILDKIKYPYKFLEGRKTKNNTGICGVREVTKSRKHGNREYFSTSFIATGKINNGKLQQKSFSINVYGRKVALQKAIEARKQFLNNY